MQKEETRKEKREREKKNLRGYAGNPPKALIYAKVVTLL